MKNEVPKERFMNRSEWMANKFKNQNVGTYDWVPEIMTSIDPAPTYHEKALKPGMGPHHYKKVRGSEGIEDSKQNVKPITYSVVKNGLPVPAEKITTLPDFNRLMASAQL